MSMYEHAEPRRRGLRYHVGNTVTIVQGPDRGRIGEVISINPASARPYLVKFNESWYIHFAEDRLVLAPTGGHPASTTPPIQAGAGRP